MEAINDDDVKTILKLRHHRNEIAHELPKILPKLKVEEQYPLFREVSQTLFKLSSYLAYVQIGADPELGDVDWNTAKGHEYLVYEEIVSKIRILSGEDISCT